MKKLMIIALLGAFVMAPLACTNDGIDEDLGELSIHPKNVDLGNGDKAKELEEDEDEGI